MASNDNGKHKLEEEAKSSTVRKRLWLSDDDVSDDDSFDSPEEETEEEEEEEEETEQEVSSEETSMNQLDTSEMLFAKRSHDMILSDDGDTTSPSLEPCTFESCWRFNEDSINEDDDFWM
jgi:hypothetical protein